MAWRDYTPVRRGSHMLECKSVTYTQPDGTEVLIGFGSEEPDETHPPTRCNYRFVRIHCWG